MNWIRAFWGHGPFSTQGSLVKFTAPTDNYNNITLFMNATLTISNQRLTISNQDYDPDQQQQTSKSFPISDQMYFTHFSYTDQDDQMISGIKWRSLQTSEFFGFLFQEPKDFQKLQKLLQDSKVQVQQQGYQHPSFRAKADPHALRNISSGAPSNISKMGVNPNNLGFQQQAKVAVDLNFKSDALENLSHLYQPQNIVFMSAGNLFFIDTENRSHLQQSGIGFLFIKHPQFQFSFDVVKSGQIVIRNIMNTNFNYQIDSKAKQFIWVQSGTYRCWMINTLLQLEPLQQICRVAEFQRARQQDFEKTLNQQEKEWIRGGIDQSFSQQENLDMDIDWNQSIAFEETQNITDSINGHLNPIAIVATDTNMKCYQVQGEALNIVGELPIPSYLNPYNLQFHLQQNQVLMLDQKNRAQIYCMDINRGQIVEEWSADGASKLNAINPLHKFAPRSLQSTFTAMSDKSLFLLDPRIPNINKKVDQQNYAKSQFFTCMATSAAGYVVTGSKKGEIKLFTRIGQRAKTSLPGLGDPIIGIDVTKDGDWVLATTETYLIVIPVVSDGINGFTKALGKKKRKPQKLILKPQDIARYGIQHVKFTKARFNIDEEQRENAIITSTGSVVVIWNFLQIRKGKLSNYILRDLEHPIIKNEFRYGEEDLIVTHPQKIQLQKNRVRFHGV